jgi:hypothetical protein
MAKEKIGEAVTFAWAKVQSNWMLPCAFAQSDLTRVAYHLADGNLWLPGHGQVGELRLCPLGQLGSLGPDRRDIHDGFELSRAKTAYAAFWGHSAEAMLTLAQQPNQFLAPLAEAKSGRSLRKVEDLWPLAGKILLAERLRLNTQRVNAVQFTRSLCSRMCGEPFAFKDDLIVDQIDRRWLYG